MFSFFCDMQIAQHYFSIVEIVQLLKNIVKI